MSPQKVLLAEEVITLADRIFPNFQDLVDPKADDGIWACSSYLFPQKISHHCAVPKV